MDIADEEKADIPRTLQQLCRLCLGDESLESIFAQDDLHEWISDFLSIMVCMDDKITKSICFCCRTRLTEFRNFQLQCMEVQDVLQGEMTAILNEKALELIATEPENDTPQLDTANLAVDWEQVPIAAATAHPPELLPPNRELSGEHSEWEAAEDSVIQEESEWGGGTSSIVVASVQEAWTDGGDVANNLFAEKVVHEKRHNTRASDVSVPKVAILQKPFPYKCDLCEREYQTKKQLSNHRSNHTKRFPCTLCDKAFHRPVRLKQHMLTHGKRNELPAQTEATAAPIEIVDSPEAYDISEEVPESNEDIIMEPTAATETALVSDEIVNAIKVEELMIEDVEIDHEPVAQADSSGTEAVEIAKKITGSAPVKRRRDGKSSSNSKGVECNLCGKKFLNKKQYHGHRWFVHSPKNHICSYCGKGYISPGRLAVHQRCHRRDKQHNHQQHFVLPGPSEDPKEVIVLPEVDSFAEAEDAEENTIECNICHKMYGTVRRLQAHKRLIHGSKQYMCPVCSKAFHIRESMIKHMLVHKETLLTIYQRPEREEVFDKPLHGPRVHVCYICKETFVQMRDMEIHKATHTTEEEVKYSLERERCKSKMVTVTQGSETFDMFQCMQCHKLVHTRRQLFDHRKRVHKPRKYTCPICGKPFVTRQDLYMHIKSHDNTARFKTDILRNEDGQFACDICHRVLGSKFTLSSHIRMVHGTRRFICSYDHCKMKFTTSYDMRKHYMIHSNNKRMHQCHLCAGRFVTKTKLVEHLKWHERKEKLREKVNAQADSQTEVHEVQVATDDAVVVTVIDVDANNIDKLPSSEDKVEDFLQSNSEWMKEASTRKTAVMEVRYGTVHDLDGKLKRGCDMIPTQNCPICKLPIQASLMEGHLNRHAGVQPYKCEKGCDDAYYYCRLLLRNHYTRIHGNMPSECDICHKVYPSRLRMRSHQREVHEKIHVCMNCPKIFDSLESLKKHIETANHTKRYACTQCSSSFDRQHQFNKHMKIHGIVGEIIASSSTEVEDSIEVETVKVESRIGDDGQKPTKS